jgi:hypothetical protein
LLARELYTSVPIDGKIHEFECDFCARGGLSSVTFLMTGPDGPGSPQLCITHWDLCGYVAGPRSIIETTTTVAPDTSRRTIHRNGLARRETIPVDPTIRDETLVPPT